MQNSIKVLKQTELCGRQFDVYGSAEEPLFVATDVATIINHPNTSELVKIVDDDEKLTSTILRSGQNREVWLLTESGLYEVLMQSRKPIAKEFKKGVKAILKEIRTNGGYLATTQEDTPELIMARALQVAQRTIDSHKQQLQIAQGTIEAQQEELKAIAPLADYTREVLQSTSTFTATQIAKDLGMSAVTLNSKLRKLGIQFYQSGQWFLTAKYQGRGYTDMRIAKYVDSRTDEVKTSQSLVWTERGRLFINSLSKEGRI